MKLRRAIAGTLRSNRFWLWQFGGALIYGIPAAIRFATGNVQLPILSLLETPVFGHYIPANLVEKIIVNAFFPGGAGGIAGEVLATNFYSVAVTRKIKYLSRLGGAIVQTAAWSAFQYWGYSLMILGPWSVGRDWGNIFEYWTVFPLNFALACFSIFTPDIVRIVKSRTNKACTKLLNRNFKNQHRDSTHNII
jgi:hypothetical protein